MFFKLKNQHNKKVDFEELCINWVAGQNWDLKDKASLAFQIINRDKNHFLFSEQIINLVSYLEFDRPKENKEKIIQSLLAGKTSLNYQEFKTFIEKNQTKIFDI